MIANDSVTSEFLVSDDSLRYVSMGIYNSEGIGKGFYDEWFSGPIFPGPMASTRNLTKYSILQNGPSIFNGTTSTVTFYDLPDDIYSLDLYEDDESGNVVTETVDSIYVDNTAPEINFGGFSDGSWYSSSVTPTVNFTDMFMESTSVVFKKNDTTVTGWMSGTAVSEDGTYTVYAEASDIAGHTTTASAMFYIDATAPQISFSGFTDGSHYNTTVTPHVLFSDSMSLETTLVNIYKDGTLTAYNPGDDITEEGAFEVFAEANDTAGNYTSASATFVIDNTAPTVNITSPVDGEIYKESVSIDATYTGNPSNFEVFVDDSKVSEGVPYMLDTSAYSDGEHTITVSVSDLAGNESSDYVNVTFDDNPPVISCDITDGSYLATTTVIPDVKIDDVTFMGNVAWLNGELYDLGTTITGEGEYELNVLAVDYFNRATDATFNLY